jgi:hypothetical protein
MFVSSRQKRNAWDPMEVTLSGMFTIVTLVQSANALDPMVLTALPSIVSGIVIAPPLPV